MGQSQPSAAIDFGISNIDAVARAEGELHCWTRPSGRQPTPDLVRAILADGGVKLSSLRRLAVTGGQHRLLPDRIDDCALIRVDEVEAIGRGGQALIEMSDEKIAAPILVVSAGSGTAVVEAHGDQCTHVTGTGVGGGTLIGLSRLLLHTTDYHVIDALAQRGDPNGADLSLADVVTGHIGQLPPDATAVNFGRLARRDISVSREDLAAALVTLVSQTIALIAINAARARHVERIVITGHLTDMNSVRHALGQVSDIYGMRLTLPQDAGYGTALGALEEGL